MVTINLLNKKKIKNLTFTIMIVNNFDSIRNHINIFNKFQIEKPLY
jgi:hypothetical protein